MDGFVNTNVFDNVLKHSSGYVSYSVDKNRHEEVKESKPQTEQSVKTLESAGDTFAKSSETESGIGASFDNAIDTVSIPNQTRKQRLKTFGIIGASAVAAGALAIFLTRGRLSKSVTKLLGNIADNAAKKIELLKQKPNISKAEGYYLTALQKINGFAYKTRGAIFNITPVKDVIFKKFVSEKCRLKKPCDSITEGFRKLSFATVKSSYVNAGKNMAEMTEAFSGMNKRIASGEFAGIKTVPASSVIEKLDRTTKYIDVEFKSSFGPKSVDLRSEKMMKTFENLDEKVYDAVYGKLKNFVTDVNEWTTFVSERLVARDKEMFMSDLLKQKKLITNKPKDNYKVMSEILSELDKTINPQHEASRVCVRNLKGLTEKYVGASGLVEKESRFAIVEGINENIEKALQMSGDAGITPAQTKKVNALLNKLSQVINSDKKGAIEEMLTLYKEYLPAEEYVKLRKIADRASESLNKAVYSEGFDYVDKLRDLAVGSALTDVAIGMGIPTITTGVALAGANTKEKKRSVVLKYGLPLLAGVATSTLCTIRLISGGGALLLGGAVTLVGNEICERIDNYILKKEGKYIADTKKIKKKSDKPVKA